MHVSPRQQSRVSVFVGDASGAVVAALIALPYGLAMASLMGLPPWLGLVTSIATAPVTALLGRNPVLIGGTASATARVNPKLPAPLLGLVAALAAARFFGLHESVVGAFDLKLPPPAAFSWTADDLRTILPAGLGLAFVASVNLLLTSRVVEHFRGRHQPLKRGDADRQLGAYAIANLAAAMFAAPLSVGIPARSLASIRCGATTRMSNLLHAVILLALVALGGPLIAGIPLAALAAVTAYVGFGLLEWSTWK